MGQRKRELELLEEAKNLHSLNFFTDCENPKFLSANFLLGWKLNYCVEPLS